ncbi:MAG TPA: ATP-binding cassette domain-containing protein [Tepidisphaeraceae bacterium]|jgi:hypothetical protein
MSIATQFIHRVFDLPPRSRPRPKPPGLSIDERYFAPGRVTLVTGPSGSGKSTLLRRLRAAGRCRRVRWIEPSQMHLPERPVIDVAADAVAAGPEAVERALSLLARVGLAEAWLYLKKPSELSDGQRWRLILALAIADAMRPSRGPGASTAITLIAMDEFAALLDRVTAAVVARALRRLIDATTGLSAVIVTSHDDLLAALDPDYLITCDFDAALALHRPRGGKD